MTNKALHEFLKHGGWNSSYSSHYQSAWQFFKEYTDSVSKLQNEESRIRDKYKGDDKDCLDYLIRKGTDWFHDSAYRYATSAHLFVCMTIEGFTNFYGTKRLGETTYKKLLERIGITEKISLIYLLCFEIRS